MTDIPKDHPRYVSLLAREKLAKGVEDGITSKQGLIAQGRGEAFDYLIGERTTDSARKAERAAVAMMLLAKSPTISVNGNVAALVAKEICELSEALDAPLEVNLFHRTEERVEKIVSLLKANGAKTVYGDRPDRIVPGLSHDRAKATAEGIYSSDVVLIPLEDGDRCEALVRMGKKVIAIDLNPLSRTSKMATVTIVDNIVRAVPNMTAMAKEMKKMTMMDLGEVIEECHNETTLAMALDEIARYLQKEK